MKSFQFQVVDEDTRKPLEELTPVVESRTLTEAMSHPTIIAWCKERNARIFKVVGQ